LDDESFKISYAGIIFTILSLFYLAPLTSTVLGMDTSYV